MLDDDDMPELCADCEGDGCALCAYTGEQQSTQERERCDCGQPIGPGACYCD